MFNLGYFQVNATLANIFFAFLTVVGELGQNVTLPLWIDSSPTTASEENVDYFQMMYNNSFEPTNSSNVYKPRMDCFFVYFFSCTSFVVLFGIALTVICIFQPHQLGATERRFPHTQLFLVGFFDSLNGTLIVFASSGKRTAPYLQAILVNVMIPLVMIFRWVKGHMNVDNITFQFPDLLSPPPTAIYPCKKCFYI